MVLRDAPALTWEFHFISNWETRTWRPITVFGHCADIVGITYPAPGRYETPLEKPLLWIDSAQQTCEGARNLIVSNRWTFQAKKNYCCRVSANCGGKILVSPSSVSPIFVGFRSNDFPIQQTLGGVLSRRS